MARFTRGILHAAAHGSKRFIGLWTPPTVAALAGTVLTVMGLHMVYPPLAFIVPGTSLFLAGLWLAGVPFSLSRRE